MSDLLVRSHSREYLKCGFLVKQGHLVKNWKRRYFVLTEDELSYYSDDSLRAKKNTIEIESIDRISQGDDMDGRSFIFHLVSNSTLFVMSADSEEDRKAWLNAIQAAYKHDHPERVRVLFSRARCLDPKEDFNSYANRILTNFFNSLTGADLIDSLTVICSYLYRILPSPSGDQQTVAYDKIHEMGQNLVTSVKKKRHEAQLNLIWDDSVEVAYQYFLQTIEELEQEMSSIIVGSSIVQEPNVFDAPSATPKRHFNSNYRLICRLGAGAFATVHEAENVVTALLSSDSGEQHTLEHVAVKFVSKGSLSESNMKSILNEVTVMSGLSHPNILRMIEYYDEPKYICIVTELAKGGELFERIVQKKRYSEDEARQTIETIVKAIQYCHSQNVVHRDLKPENILYNSEGILKIGDFGFAKDISGSFRLETDCGSPWYVAPEVLGSRMYGNEVDMWSIGVIMYVLLCGFPPFYDKNQNKLFKKIKSAQYSFIPPYWNNVSGEAKDLISHLLVVDPRVRYGPEEVLNHPWFKMSRRMEELPLAHDTIKSLKKQGKQNIMKSGYLTKRGYIIHNWKRRFFELKSEGIYYYPDQSCPDHKGFIPMNTVKSVTIDGPESFTIHTEKRDFEIKADSSFDCYTWKRAILSMLRCFRMTVRAENALREDRILSSAQLLYEARRTPGMNFNSQLVRLWRSLSNKECEVHSCVAIWPTTQIIKISENIIQSFKRMVVAGKLCSVVSDVKSNVIAREASLDGMTASDSIVRSITLPDEVVVSMDANPSFGYIVLVTDKGNLYVLDNNSFKIVNNLHFHLSEHGFVKVLCHVTRMIDQLCIAADEGGSLTLVRVPEMKGTTETKHEGGRIVDIAISSEYLLSAGVDHCLIFWSVGTLTAFQKLSIGYDTTCVSSLGKDFFLSGDSNGYLHMWRTNVNRQESDVSKPVLHRTGVEGILVSEDKSVVLTVGKERDLILWRSTPELRIEAACNRESSFRGGEVIDRSTGFVLAGESYLEGWVIDNSYTINGRLYYPPIFNEDAEDQNSSKEESSTQQSQSRSAPASSSSPSTGSSSILPPSPSLP